ncbi:MerR family transcriptional regulator [Nocardioides alcanivorans]|uniref:MerR family transcriptional regulator n=1 Tax=Nocardioides alcanivorans TaxID=2897352 RepID=UPI0024B1358F|nr:MerR family transcriptional regulator [Nocardioides alcanivorans]
MKKGRQGFYTPVHVARLELVRELQAHGFTLAAIEKYVARVPADATPESISLHRTLLAPWTAEQSEPMTRDDLDARAGRVLSDDEIEVLVALEAIRPREDDDHFDVTVAHLDACLALIQFGYPLQAALAARAIMTEHATAIAESLNALFHEQVWPAFRASGAQPSDLLRAVETIKPITTAALVSHYEAAVTRAIGGRIARLTGEETP